MQMDVVTIISEARTAWIDPSVGFITHAETLRWFNIAQQDFILKTDCFTGVWDITTVDETQEYVWDADDGVLQILRASRSGEDVFPVTEDVLTSYDRNWRQTAGGTTGEPEWYYVDHPANTLGLYPCPDAEYTINVVHTKQPTVLELVEEALPVDTYPDIASAYHHMLIPMIEWFGHRKNRDSEMSAQAWRGYASNIKKVREIITNPQPDRVRAFSGPEYAMRPGKPGYPTLPSNYGRYY